MKLKYLILSALSCAIPVEAAPRDSADYSINAEAVDSGGHRSTSTNYTSDGSSGLIAGYSTASSPAGTEKTGYIGQLYEVIGIALNGSSPNVNELETIQLDAWQLLDDNSLLETDADSFTWNVISGPVSEISARGLATTGPVYQNTQATIQGSYAGFVGWFNFTVLDLLTDNFGSYAGDGIADSWQNRYFGENNPDAGPLIDPDADGVSNLFEYAYGLEPKLADLAGNLPAAAHAGGYLTFTYRQSKAATDLTFTPQTSTDMTNGSWSGTGLTETAREDMGDYWLITVRHETPVSAAPARFARLRVTR